MKPRNHLAGLALLVIFIFSSCEDKSTIVCDPGPQFDIDLFMNLMEQQAIDDGLSGYQIVVTKNGNFHDSRAGGIARHSNDGGEIPMTVNTRLNVASVSKLIAAIALLKALEIKGLDPDDYMISHLPERWKNEAHSSFRRDGSPNLITFRELTQHRTGFDWGQDGIASTSTPSNDQCFQVLQYAPNPKTSSYHNGNFCFIRVLIGELIYSLDDTATDYNEVCTEKYFEFLDTYLFNYTNNTNGRPASTLDAYDAFYAGNHPWAYKNPWNPDNPTSWKAGIGRANSTNNAGTSGLLLSAMDVASLMAWTVHGKNGEILSAEMQEALLEDGNDMGFFASPDREHGIYHIKGGTKGPNSDDCAIKSFVAVFPNGVEAVFITNSDYSRRNSIVLDNYDAAWVDPC